MKYDTNNYWEQLERLEKLIRAAELKAGIIFSFHSLILGIFVDRMNYLQSFFEENITFVIVAGLWMLAVLISIYHCFKCFRPRIETKFKKNVFFFRDAIREFGDYETYSKKLFDVCTSEEEMLFQLGQQVYIESKIIDEKFVSIQKSLKYFAISFAFFMAFILSWIVQQYF